MSSLASLSDLPLLPTSHEGGSSGNGTGGSFGGGSGVDNDEDEALLRASEMEAALNDLLFNEPPLVGSSTTELDSKLSFPGRPESSMRALCELEDSLSAAASTTSLSGQTFGGDCLGSALETMDRALQVKFVSAEDQATAAALAEAFLNKADKATAAHRRAESDAAAAQAKAKSKAAKAKAASTAAAGAEAGREGRASKPQTSTSSSTTSSSSSSPSRDGVVAEEEKEEEETETEKKQRENRRRRRRRKEESSKTKPKSSSSAASESMEAVWRAHTVLAEVSQIGLFSLEQQGLVGKGASYSSSSFSSLQAPDQNAASGAMSSRRQAQSSPEGSQGEMFKEGPIPLAAWQRT